MNSKIEVTISGESITSVGYNMANTVVISKLNDAGIPATSPTKVMHGTLNWSKDWETNNIRYTWFDDA